MYTRHRTNLLTEDGSRSRGLTVIINTSVHENRACDEVQDVLPKIWHLGIVISKLKELTKKKTNKNKNPSRCRKITLTSPRPLFFPETGHKTPMRIVSHTRRRKDIHITKRGIWDQEICTNNLVKLTHIFLVTSLPFTTF